MFADYCLYIDIPVTADTMPDERHRIRSRPKKVRFVVLMPLR